MASGMKGAARKRQREQAVEQPRQQRQAGQQRQPEQQQQAAAPQPRQRPDTAAGQRQRPVAVKRQAEPESPPWWVDLLGEFNAKHDALRESMEAKIEASKEHVLGEVKASEARVMGEVKASEARVLAEIKAAELRQSQVMLKQTWMMIATIIAVAGLLVGYMELRALLG